MVDLLLDERKPFFDDVLGVVVVVEDIGVVGFAEREECVAKGTYGDGDTVEGSERFCGLFIWVSNAVV